MTNPARDQVLPWLMLLLLALIWGSSFILIKQGLLVFSAGEVGALRIVFAGLVLTPMVISKLKTLPARQWGLLFIIGLVGSFIPAFLFATAQTEITSGLAGVLNATTPIFTLLIGGLFFGMVIRSRAILGIFLGFVGVTILILSGQNDNVLDNFNGYALLVVLATVCYGINVNIIKSKTSHLSSLTITGVSLVLVMPIAVGYLLGFTDLVPKVQSSEGVLWSLGCLAILGVVGTALALILFNRMVQLRTPVFAAQVTYLIPIFALLWGLVDDEQILWGHLGGMLAILLGVYVTNRK